MTSDLVGAFDRAAASYDNVGVDFFTPIGAALVAAVAPAPGERLLDVGCGRGAVLFAAADAVGPAGSVVGTDLAPAMVSLTAAAAADRPHITVTVGDAQAPDFPDGSFDVVTAGLVIFFLPSPAAALAAYHRVLRPGGRLAFSSFAAHDPLYRQALQILLRHAPGTPPPFRPPAMFDSAAGLVTAVTEAGFSGTQVREIAVESRFRDVDQLLAWIGSHGGRQLLDQVPADRMPAARAALVAELPAAPTFTTRIRILVATA
jgi:ubiquinone/menaquinone biosynthesis C-methylase UbiE